MPFRGWSAGLCAALVLFSGLALSEDRHKHCTNVSPDEYMDCGELMNYAMGICMEYFMVQQDYCSQSCGRAPCLEQPVKQQNLTSDGQSSNPTESEKGKKYTSGGTTRPPKDSPSTPPMLVPENPPASLPESPADRGTSAENGAMASSGGGDSELPCAGDFAATRRDLRVLSAALEATGLSEALNNKTFLNTFFAPSDDAFKRLLDDLRLSPEELVTGNLAALIQFLQVHVVPNVSLQAADLKTGDSLPTLLMGQALTIMAEDGVVVVSPSASSANVVEADINVCNGVVHVINSVLVPGLVVPTIPMQDGLPDGAMGR